MFIFGSGTSPAPDVWELTQFVLKARMHRGDGPFYLGDEGGANHHQRACDNPDCIRHFLDLIKTDIASCHPGGSDAVTYEDIANVCVPLDKESGSNRNIALLPYREELCSKMEASFPAFARKNGDFGGLTWAATDWIAWAVFHAIRHCDKEPHALRGFAKTVIASSPGASIVTLNHDTHLEQILGDRASLGFRRTQKDIELFDPDALSAVAEFRLLKLHGSIDWFHHADSNAVRRFSGLNAMETDSPPILLAGTVSKLEDYNFGIFPWLWAEFQNSLRLTRRIVISGYGFKDVGVNARLNNWLNLYADARIAIIHPKPHNLIAETKRSRVATICNFFERDHEVMKSSLWPGQKSLSQIAFLPVKFEAASHEDWAAWLKHFIESA